METEEIQTYRLLRLVKTIRWELCQTEAQALLLENRYLREWKPPFNRVNVMPENHPFLTLRADLDSRRLVLRFTTEPKQGESVYGAFKGRGTCRRGYAALLRLLWAAEKSRDPLVEEIEALTFFPPELMRERPPVEFAIPVDGPPDWLPATKHFLTGTSDELLATLTTLLLEQAPGLHPFHYSTIEEDLATLAEFYEVGPLRTRNVRRAHKIRRRVVGQNELDDLLALRSINR